jgi:hypothetical protein
MLIKTENVCGSKFTQTRCLRQLIVGNQIFPVKLAIYFFLGLHELPLGSRRSLLPFEHISLQNMKYYQIFSFIVYLSCFLGHTQ